MTQSPETDGRDLLRLTTAGSVDDGKSTLIGRLLADSGALTTDQLTTLAAPAFREGHEQYTRNMVTGASKATAALLLVDVRGGMTVQTRRHACIAALLGIRDVVFAVNKMDLVDYAEDAFEKVKAEIEDFTKSLDFRSRWFVPVSAKIGDNVVRKSEHTPWYRGEALLSVLEQVPASVLKDAGPFRMAVQIASRPQGADTRDFRGYMGRITQGGVRVGDKVRIAPGPLESTVTGILTPAGEAQAATVGQSVTLTLADDVDYRVDVNSLERVTGSEPLRVNEIGEARIRLQDDVAFDPYSENTGTGALIIVDTRTNTTVAAGMIEHTL